MTASILILQLILASPGAAYSAPVYRSIATIPGSAPTGVDVDSTISATSGGGQSAVIGQIFPARLSATVTDNQTPPQPVAGAVVNFAVTSGWATFPRGAQAKSITGSNGVAIAPKLTAGPTAGGVVVSVAVAGSATTVILAENVTSPIATTIVATSGNDQPTDVAEVWPTGLSATVTDNRAPAQPVVGALVTFTVISGLATFTGGTSTTVSLTAPDGVATAPTLTAGPTPGPVVVSATTPGVAGIALFAESVASTSRQTIEATGNGLTLGWTPIVTTSGISSVDEENKWALAVVNDGVITWGTNTDGQLGNGNTIQSSLSAVNVGGLSNVIAVDGGNDFGLALTTAGTVYSWGSNVSGDLGLPSAPSKILTPEQIPGLSNVVQVSAGNNHALALLSNGTVMSWGNNLLGELGIGNTVKHNKPVLVPGLTDVVAVSAGRSFSTALRANGTVMTWGANAFGQLGDGSTATSLVPVAVAGLPTIVQISAGGSYFSNSHVLALDSNGDVWAWGDSQQGQLGVPSAPGITTTPVQVAGLPSISSVSAGGSSSAAVDSSGDLWVWGCGTTGQLGTGNTSNVLSPQLSMSADVTEAWAGAAGTVAVVAS
jgi:alpha-tubulin suppressor-like RCC1 family protein